MASMTTSLIEFWVAYNRVSAQGVWSSERRWAEAELRSAINCLDRDPHGRGVDLDGSSQRSTHDR